MIDHRCRSIAVCRSIIGHWPPIIIKPHIIEHHHRSLVIDDRSSSSIVRCSNDDQRSTIISRHQSSITDHTSSSPITDHRWPTTNIDRRIIDRRSLVIDRNRPSIIDCHHRPSTRTLCSSNLARKLANPTQLVRGRLPPARPVGCGSSLRAPSCPSSTRRGSARHVHQYM